jgi:hypothetical protein
MTTADELLQTVKLAARCEEAKPVDFEEEKKVLDELYAIFGEAVFIPHKIWGPPDEAGNFGAKGAPVVKYWPKLT